MNDLVAFFEYEKNKYYIYLLKNKRILFLKSNQKNQFTTNLSNHELETLRKVYKSLLINHNTSTYIKDLKVQNNLYKLFFDKTSHNYFWIPNNGEYNNNHNQFLNFRYNHQPEIVYSEALKDHPFKKSSFYTKFIKLGSKLFPILISASLSLTLLNGCTVLKQPQYNINKPTINELYQEGISPFRAIDIIEDNTIKEISESTEKTSEDAHQETLPSTEEETREYNYEEIRQAIESNPNIGEQEKDFLYKLKFIFDENHQYMDLDLVILRLSTLEINYSTYLPFADASYNLITNKISTKSENFESINKVTFLHECLHIFQDSANSFIGELSTEYFAMETMIRIYKEGIFEKEFFLSQYSKGEYQKGNLILNDETDWLAYLAKNNRFSSGYNGYTNLYSMLAEILPEETLRNYQFHPKNIEILAESLSEIDKSSDLGLTRAYQLINSINELRVYSLETNSYSYSKDISTCCESLNYYIKISKGVNLDEDLVSSLYLQLEKRLNDNFDSNVLNYLSERYNILKPSTIIPKTHLSDTQNNYVLIYYNENKEPEIIEITDEIQSEYQSYISEINNEVKSK